MQDGGSLAWCTLLSQGLFIPVSCWLILVKLHTFSIILKMLATHFTNQFQASYSLWTILFNTFKNQKTLILMRLCSLFTSSRYVAGQIE
jgi:hypothetical protein